MTTQATPGVWAEDWIRVITGPGDHPAPADLHVQAADLTDVTPSSPVLVAECCSVHVLRLESALFWQKMRRLRPIIRPQSALSVSGDCNERQPGDSNARQASIQH